MSSRLSIRLILVSVSLVLLGAATGCGITERRADVTRWIRRTESELRSARGNPQRIEFDKQGNRVLVYEWQWDQTEEREGTAYTDASGVTHWTNPSTSTKTRTEIRKYVVDKTGRVVSGDWKLY